MTVREALASARNMLSALDPEDAPIESELLLRHTLKIDRVRLYLSLDERLTPEQEATFHNLLQRRLAGEPLAYITGERAFYGLDFYVNRNVLIPRPETELLVEKAISLAQKGNISAIADIGTGSGIIAIVLAVKLPGARIYATDISASALKVAKANAERYGLTDRIQFLKGDLLESLPAPCDLIIANLPYVKEEEILPFEPRIALNGGGDGLSLIKRLCRDIRSKLCLSGSLLLEIGQGQSRTVRDFLLSLYPEAEIEIYRDLAGIERVVKVRL